MSSKVAGIEGREFAEAVVERIRAVVGPGERFALHEPEFTALEEELVADCVKTGWVSSVGRYVDEFETRIAERCGTRHGVAVANGTVALQLALEVAGLTPGDEVLVPSLSFVATANAVSHARGVPHFVDSDERTLGLDPEALRHHLTAVAERRDGVTVNRLTGRRIFAVVPMHCFGQPVDMNALADVARAFDLLIVEDAAESLGSLYEGRPCGSFGRLAAVSFNGNKIVTTGGGGAIVTDDADLARRAKHLSTTAKLPHAWEFRHDEIAHNFRMPNLNAALGCAQLRRLDDMLGRKRALAERYRAAFADVPGLRFQAETADSRSNYWLDTLVLAPENADLRDTVLTALNDAGLMSRPVWTPLHRLPIYASAPRAALPVAESLERRIVNIPSSARLGGTPGSIV